MSDEQWTPSASTQNTTSGSTVEAVVQAGSVVGGIHVHSRPTWLTKPPRPRQLPAPVPESLWVDRVSVLGELTELATGQGPVVLVLVGPEGVGKSALATQLLHSLGTRFQDGQFYRDFAGQRDPSLAANALSGWLPTLGFDVPDALADRSAAWRSATADGAFAIFLDHVIDERQAESLLPNSPGSITVITSEVSLLGLARRGAFLVPVSPLEEADSAVLLTKLAGPRAHRSLAARCAGYPGRIRRLGAWLRLRNPAMTPIPDSTDQEVTLDMLYDVLSRDAQQLYRCMGDHVPNVDVQTAEAMVSKDRASTETLLGELLNAGLLEKRPAPAQGLGDRYVMNAYAHQDAAARAAKDDPVDIRAAVRKRVRDTLLGRMVAADYVLSPKTRRYNPAYELYAQKKLVPDLDASAALAWVTVELPAVLACMRDAHHVGDITTVCYLAEATWAGYLRARYHTEFHQIHEFAASAAHQAGHPMESIMWTRLSWAHRAQRQWQDALDTAESARQAAVKARDRKAESTAISARGRVMFECRHYSEARELFDKSMIIAAQAGDDRGVTLRRRHIADCWASEGQYVVAREMYLQVLEAADTQQDRLNWARTAGKLAFVLIALGQPRKAVEYLKFAEIPMAEPESTLYHAEVVDALAQAKEALGDTAEAGQCYPRAAELYETAGEIGKAEDMRTRLARLTDPEQSNLGCRDVRVHTYKEDRIRQKIAAAAVIDKGRRHGWSADETAETVLGVLHPPGQDGPSDHQQ